MSPRSHSARKSLCAPLRCAALLALWAAVIAVAGEEPQVIAQIGSDEIYMGESVEYQVQLRNIKTPVPPDMSAFDADFMVTQNGDRSLNRFSTLIVNGQMRQENSYGHLYGFLLTPKRAGNLVVPAPSVTVENQKLAARPLSLRVIQQEVQDFVVAEVIASQAKVYPTQPFDVTLRILVKPLSNDQARDPLSVLQTPPEIQINWLKSPDGLGSEELKEWLGKFVTNTGRGFIINGLTVSDDSSFFRQQRAAVFSLYTGREMRNGLDGLKVNYFVYELKRTFTAEKSGSYVFGPALVKGSIVDGISGRRYTTRKLVVSVPPQTVVVREVPSPRPATFCGGIGAYNVTASASPADLRVGDPLTLTLSIERQPGSGSLDLISAPDISANAKLVEEFDIIDKAPTGEIKGQSKTFSYGLRPKKVGASIPVLAVTTFNPDSEKYVDVQTQPVKLNVTQAAQLNAGELIGAVTPGSGREVLSRAEGVFQNISDVSGLHNQRVNPVNYIAAAAALCVLYALMSIVVATWRSRASDAIYQRRQRARSAADLRIKDGRAALSAGNPSEGLRAAHSAITGLIADMLNLSAAGMTAHEASAALGGAGISDGTKAGVIKLLESIEAAQYGSASSHDASKTLDDATQMLPQIQRELEVKR